MSSLAIKRHFGGAKTVEMELADVPDPVRGMLEALGMRYLDPDTYDPGDFYDVRRLTLEDGDAIFSARRVKDYGDRGVEESTYVIDVRNGEPVGFGEVRWRLTGVTDYFKDKPFVGFTETRRPFRRKGLAERRLRIMNALARQKYGLPVHSDTVISADARKLWEKLAGEGKARKYKEGEHDRYVYEAD